jgi:hypothetical protein
MLAFVARDNASGLTRVVHRRPPYRGAPAAPTITWGPAMSCIVDPHGFQSHV